MEKLNVSGSIAIWINSYNEKTHNSESSFYRYDTSVESKTELSEFFDTILDSIERLTKHKFTEISSIQITTHNEAFNDLYYKYFKEEYPDLNILSMHLE